MSASAAAGADAGSSDIYLHLALKRAGKAKGEVVAPGFVDDILVESWRLGAEASSAIGSTAATSRRSWSQLTLVKRVDRASTALLSALRTNDEVKEARLAMRRAGGEPVPYLTVTLAGARITSVQLDASPTGGVSESLSLAFTRIAIEYRVQGSGGAAGGAAVFEDDLSP